MWCGCLSLCRKTFTSLQNNENLAATKSVALIAPAHSYRASVFLEAAERHDIPIIFISDGDSEVVLASRAGIRVDFSDPAKAKQIVYQHLQASDVQAIIAPDEKYVAFAADISRRLGLPHNSVDALNVVSNKYLARKQLRSSKFDAIPGFELVDLNRQLPDQISGVSFPCVAKPLNLSASRGVIRANDEHELLEALQRIRRILVIEFGETQSIHVLVEDYIEGTEHVLEGYLNSNNLEVICIFDKPDALQGPYFEETYYVTPSRLPKTVQEEIKNVVASCCNCHGLTMGPIHAEVRVSEEKVWMLEIAARSIGGDCSRLFELANQSSLEEFIVRRAVGHPVEALNLDNAAGVMMIPVTEEGILRRVEGVTEAQSVDHILEVRLDVREGERLVRWPEGGKYPGFIYSMSDSPEQTEFALRKSYSHLKFVCMPELPVVVKWQ